MADVEDNAPELSGLRRRMIDAATNPQEERRIITETLTNLRDNELDEIQNTKSKHERLVHFNRAKDFDLLLDLYENTPRTGRTKGSLSDPRNTLQALWDKGMLTPVMNGVGYSRSDLSTLPFDHSDLPEPDPENQLNYSFGGQRYFLGGTVVGFDLSFRSIHNRVSNFMDSPQRRGHTHSVKLYGVDRPVQTDDNGARVGNGGAVHSITFDEISVVAG